MIAGPGPILVLCTGNTCRSPMAEALWRRDVPGIPILSAGLDARAGAPASPHAIAAMAEIGLDLAPHRSRRATAELVAGARLVFVMTAEHRRALADIAPDAAGRARLLDPAGIEDPHGGDLVAYRACRDRLAAALRGLAASSTMA